MRRSRQLLPLLATTLLSLLPAVASAAEPAQAEIVSVQKIWDQGKHNAFTDLIWKDGEWFCVFREGDGHVSPNGALRVLSSKDGKSWASAALITATDSDLRDAKICIAPGNRLMLCGAGALHKPVDGLKHQSYVWYSEDGRKWGDAIPVGDLGYWLWRVTWQGDVAYSVGYGTGSNRTTRLYRSLDGRKFETLVPELVGEGYPNESSLLFQKDGTGLCLLRRDDKEAPNAMLGTATAPYDKWSFKTLDTRIGGPQLIDLPDGRVVVSGRDYVGKAKTSVWFLNPKTGKLDMTATLPSGGDTSYPGLVFRDGLLWVSYYSSHEGKTSIYLAKLKLPEKS
ncbi:hypothetical protein Pan44_42940 [Caulifigura coniformis]|uniref:Exo-alpha-sialidase n=1 Tax=Caulifigura coniformis TaxID=2527983 RepID=A0A517SJE0_9PLAN|nr:sialidase family protein [Caulifigura coniformis]QDT56242.1 hypothetical protein Pan44_42940 [Caulifigura coniformis]